MVAGLSNGVENFTVSGFTEDELREIIRDELREALRDVRPRGQHMTVAEIAEWLNVAQATVRARANQGDWPSVKIGKQIRFSPDHQEEIERLIERHGTDPLDKRRRGEIEEALRLLNATKTL